MDNNKALYLIKNELKKEKNNLKYNSFSEIQTGIIGLVISALALYDDKKIYAIITLIITIISEIAIKQNKEYNNDNSKIKLLKKLMKDLKANNNQLEAIEEQDFNNFLQTYYQKQKIVRLRKEK